MDKILPTDEFGNTVLTSKKKYEKCYFCEITIISNPWFTFIEDKNCKDHILSVPICDNCSRENSIKEMGKIVSN